MYEYVCILFNVLSLAMEAESIINNNNMVLIRPTAGVVDAVQCSVGFVYLVTPAFFSYDMI